MNLIKEGQYKFNLFSKTIQVIVLFEIEWDNIFFLVIIDSQMLD